MPNLSLEADCYGHVIGIDEAGRGPWAGPVTITALWLNPDAYDQLPDDINDSKKIKPRRRACIAEVLQMPPHLNCTISKNVDDIDQHGVVFILSATQRSDSNHKQKCLHCNFQTFRKTLNVLVTLQLVNGKVIVYCNCRRVEIFIS